jgi:5'(3')-deoxyribonucleotidase
MKLLGKAILKQPNFFEAWRYFQNAQNLWAEIKTIFNIYKVPAIMEHNKNFQNAKKFQALGFFRCPIILGRNEKNQHL